MNPPSTSAAQQTSTELRIDPRLAVLVDEEMAPGSGITADQFWDELAAIVADLGPKNAQLLARRDELQTRIDQWYRHIRMAGEDVTAPRARASFLRSIGYLVDEPDDFEISTDNVDPEIATIAGPQLVVPVDNARYAINAANARWGSLFDALYGTDAIPEGEGTERGTRYNPTRGAEVIERATAFLDATAPLVGATHGDVRRYQIAGTPETGYRLTATLITNSTIQLEDPSMFAGFTGMTSEPDEILLRHNGLHIELQINRDHPIGATHQAGLADILLESALTTIQDCEDSVAAVDADDKARVYRNWLGLMRGTLTATFKKGDRSVARQLNPDRHYTNAAGDEMTLPGRSLMLVRNVGIHMYTDAVTTAAGEPIPEGFLDIMMTALAAKHDLLGNGRFRNSRTGSVYVVKPKQHGPEEIAATVELFSRVEQALGLPERTLKIGIMDEERRTTINLKACIYEARDRVVFVNTGFLDRTGDEIHTMMEGGPVYPKAANKTARWLCGYEDANVDTALATGFSGRAQIGKGMWAIPDQMAQMMDAKIDHPRTGASTAWVPSPTAATLHAMHYHAVDVADIQTTRAGAAPRSELYDLLAIPLMQDERSLRYSQSEHDPAQPSWPTAEQIQRELDNNAQSILGYVVRWIQQGIGCSKVPDIDNVGLMEDRATLRISSQHIANWMRHRLFDETAVRQSFAKMAAIVDQQNARDPYYQPMGPDLDDSIAFQAALALALEGRHQPNGYTEFLLHEWRRKYKAQQH